jgi:hypothetical protein
MKLVEEFTYRVMTTQPLGPTEGSPLGMTQYWCVSEGEISGPRIRARLAAPGDDWMQMTSDGFWRPHVRAPFITDDGALVLMSYTGLVEQTDAFQQAASSNNSTGFEDQYMRLALTFDTGAEPYSWLTRSLYVAQGRLLGTGAIEYQVHRVA